MSAATDWMLDNDFTRGACTNKNTYGIIQMKSVEEVNTNDWDNLYDDLVVLLYDFTYDELVSPVARIAIVSCHLPLCFH
jgi:hypothetical protein